MANTNSKLAKEMLMPKFFTANKSKEIKYIIIHHHAGINTVNSLRDVLIKGQISANYGIGNDGKIALYVEEKDRAWSSATQYYDNRAVTIEVSNDIVGGNWSVGEKAMNSLIKLVADIAYRNNIKEITYTGNTNGTLLMHKWFTSTVCPGQYLISQFPNIKKEANKQLVKLRNENESQTKTIDELANEVILGDWGNGRARDEALTKAGYDFTQVQKRVNEILYGPIEVKPGRKSQDELANEVIRGEWGNGDERKKRLTDAGFNYKKIQEKVNKKLGY